MVPYSIQAQAYTLGSSQTLCATPPVDSDRCLPHLIMAELSSSHYLLGLRPPVSNIGLHNSATHYPDLPSEQ